MLKPPDKSNVNDRLWRVTRQRRESLVKSRSMRIVGLTVVAGVLCLGLTACESGLERPVFTGEQSSPDMPAGNGTISISGMLGGYDLSIADHASATLEYDQIIFSHDLATSRSRPALAATHQPQNVHVILLGKRVQIF